MNTIESRRERRAIQKTDLYKVLDQKSLDRAEQELRRASEQSRDVDLFEQRVDDQLRGFTIRSTPSTSNVTPGAPNTVTRVYDRYFNLIYSDRFEG